MNKHPVETLWREVGLPEYFLGNYGTNSKLYELYDRIRASERERCIAVCESWIGTFQKFDLKHISTRDYAVDVVEDIIALIRDGTDPLVAFQPPARLCPNGLEHGNCLFPNCVSSCPGRLSLEQDR